MARCVRKGDVNVPLNTSYKGHRLANTIRKIVCASRGKRADRLFGEGMTYSGPWPGLWLFGAR